MKDAKIKLAKTMRSVEPAQKYTKIIPMIICNITIRKLLRKNTLVSNLLVSTCTKFRIFPSECSLGLRIENLNAFLSTNCTTQDRILKLNLDK